MQMAVVWRGCKHDCMAGYIQLSAGIWRMKVNRLCRRYHNADADNKARKQEGIQSAGTISQAH